MKKTIAALGASVLGLGSAAVLGAAPAAAADTTVACENLQEQVESTGSVTDNWFQDCVPQYGLGKAEFTIVPDEDDPSLEFPEEFIELTEYGIDEAITGSTTTDLTGVVEYFGSTEPSEGPAILPIIPIEELEVSAAERTYLSTIIAPIATIGVAESVPIGVADLCTLPELGEYEAWVATYDGIDSSFTQVVDGEDWTFDIVSQPKPTYFVVEGEGESFCITDGEHAIVDGDGSEAFIILGLVWPYPPDSLALPTSLPQSIEELRSTFDGISSVEIGESGFQTLGVFDLGLPEPLPVPVPEPVPGPALAPTGSDGASLLLPALIVGGVVVLGGALVVVSVIRKRRTDEPAAAGDASDTTL